MEFCFSNKMKDQTTIYSDQITRQMSHCPYDRMNDQVILYRVSQLALHDT